LDKIPDPYLGQSLALGYENLKKGDKRRGLGEIVFVYIWWRRQAENLGVQGNSVDSRPIKD